MNDDRAITAVRPLRAPRALVGAVVAFAMISAGNLAFAEAPDDGRIAYVMTHRYWAVHETENGEVECPQGFNDGPREQFDKLFNDGKVRTVMETQLMREGRQWHPETITEEPFTFYTAQGDISYGLNLDGNAGSGDFTSPDGAEGIDNELYRVIGCIANYRAGGTIYHFENEYMRRYNDNRWIIELTDVDDMTNDDYVTVTTFRGMDGLLTDATGEDFIPGGTQRIDLRWGKEYIARTQGKIVDGVLITEPIDQFRLPWGVTFNTNGYQVFRGMQLQLQLEPQSAEGLLAGYVDVSKFNHHLNTSWSTHHQSYGQLSSPSEYLAMKELADGYPDPETGVNTAISSALRVKFVQAFIQRPDEEMVKVALSN